MMISREKWRAQRQSRDRVDHDYIALKTARGVPVTGTPLERSVPCVEVDYFGGGKGWWTEPQPKRSFFGAGAAGCANGAPALDWQATITTRFAGSRPPSAVLT